MTEVNFVHKDKEEYEEDQEFPIWFDEAHGELTFKLDPRETNGIEKYFVLFSDGSYGLFDCDIHDNCGVIIRELNINTVE